MSKHSTIGIVLAVAVASTAWITSSMAQSGGRSSKYDSGMMYAQGYGPGMMGFGHGPGMMYGPGYGRRGFGYGSGMMGGCPMWGGPDDQTSSFADGRIAFLKAELNITDAQKAPWDAYAEALKSHLHSMQGMWQSMRAAFEANTPVERLDGHIAAMESRLSALKAVKPTLSNLYAALSTDQKKKANELLTGIGCMM